MTDNHNSLPSPLFPLPPKKPDTIEYRISIVKPVEIIFLILAPHEFSSESFFSALSLYNCNKLINMFLYSSSYFLSDSSCLRRFFSRVSFLENLVLIMATKTLRRCFMMAFWRNIGSLLCRRSIMVTTSGWK